MKKKNLCRAKRRSGRMGAGLVMLAVVLTGCVKGSGALATNGRGTYVFGTVQRWNHRSNASDQRLQRLAARLCGGRENYVIETRTTPPGQVAPLEWEPTESRHAFRQDYAVYAVVECKPGAAGPIEDPEHPTPVAQIYHPYISLGADHEPAPPAA